MKRLFAGVLLIVTVLSASTTAFAHGHGHRGGHHRNTYYASWHNGSGAYGYTGHYSNQCAAYGHY